MVELSDSTRRLVTFLLIVVVGSALLVFDIPVLYLLFAMLFIALVFALFTGMLILSEIIADLREQFKEYRAKLQAQTSKDRKQKKQEREERLAAKKQARAEKEAEKAKKEGEKAKETKEPKEKKKGLFGGSRDKEDKKKEDSSKDSKSRSEEAGSSTKTSASTADTPPSSSDDAGLDLDDFDLDLDIDLDAELGDIDPDIGDVRTPFAADDALEELSDKDVSRLDIATEAEQDRISLDNSLSDNDDIDSIYASTMDIGESEGEDMLANMEGGISASDLAAYNSSEDTPYDYGGDENEEEQYEASGSIGGGMDDDDLLASLKTDIDNLKKRDDNVLLRDLKDLKFTAQDLVDDLNEIIEMITKPKKRP